MGIIKKIGIIGNNGNYYYTSRMGTAKVKKEVRADTRIIVKE